MRLANNKLQRLQHRRMVGNIQAGNPRIISIHCQQILGKRALSASFIQMEQYGTRATTIIRQRYDGETEIIEQNYDAKGATEQHSYTLQLPVIGGISRES